MIHRTRNPFLASLLSLAVCLTGCVDKRKSVVEGGSTTQDQRVPQVPVAGALVATESAKAELELPKEDDKLIPLDQLPTSLTEWKKRLSPEAYEITREKGTEPPGSNKYNKHYDDGVYRCVSCGQRLFDSATKYDSHSGWPAFWKPYNKEVIRENEDDTLFTSRVEVLCTRCGAHLGHLFDDGPEETTGLRYCINSVALEFQAREDILVKPPVDEESRE